MNKILIPVDGSEHSKRAVEEGRVLMEGFGCDIVLISVIEVLTAPRRFNIAIPKPDRAQDPYADKETDVALELLKTYKESFGDLKDRVSTQILYGKAADEIIKMLNETEVDMAIMGSRGIGSPVYRNLLGSVASKVLHHAEKPVLIIQ